VKVENKIAHRNLMMEDSKAKNYQQIDSCILTGVQNAATQIMTLSEKLTHGHKFFC
jgi:hypothetical protein